MFMRSLLETELIFLLLPLLPTSRNRTLHLLQVLGVPLQIQLSANMADKSSKKWLKYLGPYYPPVRPGGAPESWLQPDPAGLLYHLGSEPGDGGSLFASSSLCHSPTLRHSAFPLNL